MSYGNIKKRNWKKIEIIPKIFILPRRKTFRVNFLKNFSAARSWEQMTRMIIGPNGVPAVDVKHFTNWKVSFFFF